jgi:hypothetical protein
MRFCTWNARNLYRSGSLKTVARGLASYILDLVDVQEVGGTRDALNEQEIIPFLWKRK